MPKELSDAAKAALAGVSAPAPQPVKHWECAGEVRWGPANDETYIVLQQKWLCIETDEVEWRDVPTVNE